MSAITIDEDALRKLLWAARLMEGHARITHYRLGDRAPEDCHGANHLRDALTPFAALPSATPSSTESVGEKP